MSNKKYTYSKSDHFRYCLQKFSDKKTINIPCEILDQIRKDIENYESFTTYDIKRSLIKLNLRKYYDQIPLIYEHLSGKNEKNSNIVTQENDDKNFECPICLQSDIPDISRLKCNHT